MKRNECKRHQLGKREQEMHIFEMKGSVSYSKRKMSRSTHGETMLNREEMSKREALYVFMFVSVSLSL